MAISSRLVLYVSIASFLFKMLEKECGCWKEILEMRSVVRGLIKKLDLALAKEVRIEGFGRLG